MKKLFLIRHAKSSWDHPKLSDHDRPLNNRGEKDAPRMAKRLKEKRVYPDIMITSSATRALETCKAMAAILKFPTERILVTKRIYHASEDELLSVLQGLKDLPDSEEVVLLFGHNPGLTEFSNLLLNESIDNIPTCGVVAAELAIQHWKNLEFGCGKMIFFDFPKSKD